MGDINDQIYIQNQMSHFQGPYLEVGSKGHGNTQDIKALFPKTEKYIGIDMEEGPRVDIVLDLTKEWMTLMRNWETSGLGLFFV